MIQRICSVDGEVNLLVVDFDAYKHYRSQRVVISASTSDIEVIETPRSNPDKSASVATADAANCKYTIIGGDPRVN